MMITPIGGLTANNAAFNIMQAHQSLLGLVSFAGTPGANLGAIHRKETMLQQNIAKNELLYKIGLIQEESMKKLRNENIKRSFSTFA